MEWSEVRKLYPDKFVLIESIKEHRIDNIKYIDKLKFIKIIEDGKSVSEILSMCKGNRFVYHTSKEELYIEMVYIPSLRRCF